MMQYLTAFSEPRRVGKKLYLLPTTVSHGGGNNERLRLATVVGKKGTCPPYDAGYAKLRRL
jgi:hypothetical protein